jgi:hypothetical protein
LLQKLNIIRVRKRSAWKPLGVWHCFSDTRYSHMHIRKETSPFYILSIFFPIFIFNNIYNCKFRLKYALCSVVSDCCLMLNEQYFSHIMARTSYIWEKQCHTPKGFHALLIRIKTSIKLVYIIVCSQNVIKFYFRNTV